MEVRGVQPFPSISNPSQSICPPLIVLVHTGPLSMALLLRCISRRQDVYGPASITKHDQMVQRFGLDEDYQHRDGSEWQLDRREPRIAGMYEGAASIRIDMSDFDRPNAHGSIVNGSSITITFPDDATYTGQLQSPNVIRWSNSSVWTKKP